MISYDGLRLRSLYIHLITYNKMLPTYAILRNGTEPEHNVCSVKYLFYETPLLDGTTVYFHYFMDYTWLMINDYCAEISMIIMHRY